MVYLTSPCAHKHNGVPPLSDAGNGFVLTVKEEGTHSAVGVCCINLSPLREDHPIDG